MQIRGKKLIYEQKRVRLPNGVYATCDRIIHPQAVVLVPFLDFSTIILVYQYRPVLKKYLFELPAGTKNTWESLRSCAKRELREETGYGA